MCWRACFDGLVRFFGSDNHRDDVWTLYLDCQACAPGMPISGEQPVKVPVPCGKVDLTPLFEFDDDDAVPELMIEAFARCPDKTRVPIPDVCCALDSIGKRAENLLHQILCQVSNMLECDILAVDVERDESRVQVEMIQKRRFGLLNR